MANITEKEFVTLVERWQKEDLLNLVNHFHCLECRNPGQSIENTSYQSIRVDSYSMNDFADFKKTLLAAGSKKVVLRMWMGLKKPDREKITFTPVFELKVGTDSYYYDSTPYTSDPMFSKKSSGILKSEEVPSTYKHMVSRNWRDTEISYIDDLFFISGEFKSDVTKSLLKVRYFTIGEEGVELIKALLPSAPDTDGLWVYPGYDMNKFSMDEVYFTPVIGIKHELESNIELVVRNIIGPNIQVVQGETYLDYSRPCPSTC